MFGPRRIEGYAIVSADGMIADAGGHMPAALKNEADQAFFHGSLDRAAAVVHGRRSHEGGPNAVRRYRLIVTRSVSACAPAVSHPKALLWNPAGVSLREAWSALGASEGTLAVIGGSAVYDLFWDGYDAFHLTRAAKARLPRGRTAFTEMAHNRTPEDVLASHGLHPSEPQVLDRAAGVTLVTWRPASA